MVENFFRHMVSGSMYFVLRYIVFQNGGNGGTIKMGVLCWEVVVAWVFKSADKKGYSLQRWCRAIDHAKQAAASYF